MLISREADYAIRVLRAIADGERHNISNMCESEQIPKQFAYKIIEKLQKSGYVSCTRGRAGGCTLKVDLREISLYDVLKAIDDDCYLNLCMVPGHQCSWTENHSEVCRVHQKLEGLQSQLNQELKSLNMSMVIFE